MARARFGKFDLIALLGRGGMADAYVAVSSGPSGVRKVCVVKRVREEREDDDAMRAMMLEEARVASRLEHANVVQTFEVGEVDGQVYLVMELLRGQPLHRLTRAMLQTRGAVDPRLSARIVADALAGLHYVHELREYDGRTLGLVHRDVSPHNVFVTYDGQVKVLDFGIAKLTGEVTAATDAGLFKGKLAYMSPEQAMGGKLDRRADLYAAGVVLWELLAGEQMHGSVTLAETLRRLIHDPVRPLPPSVPEALAQVATRALEKLPEARFDTASAMRAELEAWLETQPPLRRDDLGETVAQLFARDREKLERAIHEFMQRPPEPDGEPSRRSSPPSLGSLPSHPLFESSPAREVSQSPTRVPTLTQVPAPSPQSVETPSSPLSSLAPPPFEGKRRAKLVVAALLALVAVAVFILHESSSGELSSKARPLSSAPQPPAALPVVKPDEPPLLRLMGSNTVGAELAPALVEAFLARRDGGKVERRHSADGKRLEIVAQRPSGGQDMITLRAEGTATAFSGLAAHECDIGMASRQIRDDEQQLLVGVGARDMRSPATEHVLALDGIAVVLHASNPVRSLELGQLRELFSGEARDWSAVGGGPGAVHVYARDDRSGTFDTFKTLVLGSATIVPNARRFDASDALADAVAADPDALGFTSVSSVRNAHAVALAQDGGATVYPSAFTVATESYPLSRRLYLYTLPDAPAVAQQFVYFALSTEGQQIVRRGGFVDLDVTIQEPEACGERCTARYRQLTKGARRLSLDFRFRVGSKELDSKATRDFGRLLGFLHQHGGQLRLIGFSDSSGSASQNVRLSSARARSVANELAARGVTPTVVAGLGGEMPVSSNEDEAGREKNRRVEVWLSEGR